MISEKNILSSLDHPFIVRLSGTFQGECKMPINIRLRCSQRVFRSRLLSDTKFLYMVLEYIVGGEFFTHLRKAGRFDHVASKFYATQIILVFEYMHTSDFIYRDLKPENLLLDKYGFLKITDFGFAKRVAFKTYTLCGTPEYIAPEVLLNKGHGKGVDWWTLGILLYEMMAGQPPFVDDDPMGIYQQILAGKVLPSSFVFFFLSFSVSLRLWKWFISQPVFCRCSILLSGDLPPPLRPQRQVLDKEGAGGGPDEALRLPQGRRGRHQEAQVVPGLRLGGPRAEAAHRPHRACRGRRGRHLQLRPVPRLARGSALARARPEQGPLPGVLTSPRTTTSDRGVHAVPVSSLPLLLPLLQLCFLFLCGFFLPRTYGSCTV